jgi:NTP pyrophosphatase (non-canonical NTP hydrolase)
VTGSGDFSIGSKVWPGTSKLLEEMGELQQVLGKLIAVAGSTEHWDGDLKPKLIEELGDVSGALAFFMEKNLTDEESGAMLDRGKKKLELFREWHAENARPVEEFRRVARCARISPMGNRCDRQKGHFGPCRTSGSHVEEWAQPMTEEEKREWQEKRRL